LDRVTAAHKAGAADFLLVPFHPEVLEAKVANLAARHRQTKDERDMEKAAVTE
jgi:DNA-binding response OmpR family regulator